MLNILSEILQYFLQILSVPFPIDPSLFLLTDSSTSDELHFHSSILEAEELELSPLCDQCFKTTSCFNNIINPRLIPNEENSQNTIELKGLMVGVLKIYVKEALGPLGRVMNDFYLINSNIDWKTGVMVITAILLTGFLWKKGRKISSGSESLNINQTEEDKDDEYIVECRREINTIRENLARIDLRQTGLNQRIESIEELEIKRSKDLLENNQDQLGKIREELYQLYNNNRDRRGGGDKEDKNLKRIEEKLLGFEKQFSLISNCKEELRKVDVEHKNLLRKIEKIIENSTISENMMKKIQQNEINLTKNSDKIHRNEQNVNKILQQMEAIKKDGQIFLQEKTNGRNETTIDSINGNLNPINLVKTETSTDQYLQF